MEKVKMITIDSSTSKSGVAFWINGELQEYKLLDFHKEKTTSIKFDKMARALLDTLDYYKPNIIWLEEAVVTRNAQTQRVLLRLQGVVYTWCILNNCEFNTIRPAEWRKLCDAEFSGKREELKAIAVQFVKDRYDIETTDDVAEAICIGNSILNMFDK